MKYRLSVELNQYPRDGQSIGVPVCRVEGHKGKVAWSHYPEGQNYSVPIIPPHSDIDRTTGEIANVVEPAERGGNILSFSLCFILRARLMPSIGCTCQKLAVTGASSGIICSVKQNSQRNRSEGKQARTSTYRMN